MPDDRPNIFVICGDDIGITNLSCYTDGQPLARRVPVAARPGVRGDLGGRVISANGYELADMAGNVWEWTADRYAQRRWEDAAQCCVTHA